MQTWFCYVYTRICAESYGNNQVIIDVWYPPNLNWKGKGLKHFMFYMVSNVYSTDRLLRPGAGRVICALSTTHILFHIINHTCYSYQWLIIWNKIRVVDNAKIILIMTKKGTSARDHIILNWIILAHLSCQRCHVTKRHNHQPLCSVSFTTRLWNPWVDRLTFGRLILDYADMSVLGNLHVTC